MPSTPRPPPRPSCDVLGASRLGAERPGVHIPVPEWRDKPRPNGTGGTVPRPTGPNARRKI